jgi:hypothetical protein
VPFAALALATIAGWLRSRQYGRSLAAAAGVSACLLLWTGRPASPLQPLIRPDDWKLPYLIAYRSEVLKAQETRDVPRAIAAFEATFRDEPEPSDLRVPEGRPTADLFSRMHHDCAALLRAAGREAEAGAHLDRAAEFARVARES